ncbi:Phosphatase [Nocardia amikacinitolerans]|uniref:Phosphatase n=1 Tax=Nocardia amikacinitolerans TaxID=756689 RepID=A0A285LUT8_9NOCA|nr:phosphatase [Nocardia amikacinitolerans]MCP2295681.1 Phosphatase [Nocardia amikacinitolerans]MCP2317498.1 Phosphatase [Nocardia amikacinitolerans]SNY87877.1 Phosphatase [Nocardia amikacinitolerans]
MGFERVSRGELREHVVRSGIAGEVATPREGNLRHYGRMVAKDPGFQFGLRLRDWSFDETLAMMARLCGVNPNPGYTWGVDTIDPDLTLDALDAMGERIGAAAAERATVLLATGHPDTLLGVYRAIEDALRAAGCTVLTPAAGWSYEPPLWEPSRYREIAYASGVAALVGADGRWRHTHDPDPMRAALAELDGELPRLVVADHGWAGAAGEAGIETVGFADCNDPALFAGHDEGKIAVTVPLDDGLDPLVYQPLTAYLLQRARLA